MEYNIGYHPVGYVPTDKADSWKSRPSPFMDMEKQNQPRRIACYVDGFNLYHAIAPLGLKNDKVNLWSLTESLLRPNETLVAVNYFSAYATWRKAAYARHRAYVRDLKNSGVTPVMAHFKSKNRECLSCGDKWVEHEEKETDVRMALKMLEDAIDDVFDRAYVISADSDLVPVVQTIRRRRPQKGILIVTPPGRYNTAHDLRNAGHASYSLTTNRIRDHLFT
jgi:uncharacterized LabA/DUF88 family protein